MPFSIFKLRATASEGRRRFSLSLRLWAAFALFISQDPTRAAEYFVINSGDLGVGSGNSGDLRYCLTLANANPGSTITLADNLGTISLSAALPIITTSVTIQGGVGNVISGAGQHRIFFVNTTNATDAVGIHNLNLANGYAKGGDGGSSGGGGLGAGGALFVSTGAVTLGNVNFSNNTAQGGKGGDASSIAQNNESDFLERPSI